MNFLRATLVAIIVLPFCKSSKVPIQNNKDNLYEVVLKINAHQPYCGGALPNEINEKGFTDVIDSRGFVLKRFNKTETDSGAVLDIEFSTDQYGDATLHLSSGHYALFFIEKTLNFDTFYQNSTSKLTRFLKPISKDCFREWYVKPETQFQINSDTSIDLTIRQYCETGFNPCLIYSGPKRK